MSIRANGAVRSETDTPGHTPTMRRSPQRKGAARGAGAAWGLACVLLLPVHCAAFSDRRALQAYTYVDNPDNPDAPYCKLSDASVCWGNTYRFREVKAGSGGPFDGINLGYFDGARQPVLADLDGDGTLRPCPYQKRQRITRFRRSQATWTS